MDSKSNFLDNQLIDTRFVEEDLIKIFKFTYEGNKKNSAICQIEKNVIGKIQRCNFEASETSAVKKYNLWRHVKRHHREIYNDLVKKKDIQDKAFDKRNHTDEENKNCGPSSIKKLKVEQKKLIHFLNHPELVSQWIPKHFAMVLSRWYV